MAKRKKIVVMGFMGSCPIAGVIWQHVHYIVGLNRLGHDVYYIEDSARLPYNPQTFDTNDDYGYAGKILSCLAREFGFQRRWSYCARYLPKNPTVGLPLKTIRQLYRDADAIFNVCGTQELNDDLRRSDRLIYIESDPGVEQIKVDQRKRSTIDYLRAHHALFTFGENVGTKEFPVPLHGIKWLPTRQPIVTDLWKTSRRPAKGAVLTTIANWSTSGLKDIVWRGDKFLWSKSREFLRFVSAPRKARRNVRDGNRHQAHKDARAISSQRLAFYFAARDERRLLVATAITSGRSKGEFTVAKDQYVRLHTGWFSDRSACYLAAGRPVITQETGFTAHYGGAAGLLVYNSLGEVVEAVRKIKRDYAFHAAAAKKIAREVFEAETVLHSLLERAGV